MNIENFVKDTLLEIYNGVHGANSEIANPVNKTNFKICANGEGEISFDIAVTVNDKIEKKKGGGIKVYSVDLEANKKDINFHENVSRVKFKIWPDNVIT